MDADADADSDSETVLVTGGSAGIGRATVERFLDDGWTVYATSRDPDGVDLDCPVLELDVTDADAVRRVRDRVLEEAGGLDCLVNNAGYAQYGPVEDVPTDRLQAQFDVNVYGPHRLLRAFLPTMREQGSGTVVNVSSVSGRLATPGYGAYAGSKFALEALSDALRPELAPLGVDVVLVEPGPVATGFRERATDTLAETEHRPAYGWVYDFFEDREAVDLDAPLAVGPDDVAATVHDAASVSNPDARYPVGWQARLLLAGRLIPDRLRDGLFGLFRRVTR